MVADHVRREAVRFVATLTTPGTNPTAETLRDAAERAGVAERTVRRWWAAENTETETLNDPPADGTVIGCSGHRVWALTPAQMAVIAASPNLAEAHRDLAAANPHLPSYATFRRAVLALDAGIAATITRKGGSAALVNKRMYLTVHAPHRNARWVMDSQEIPVRTMSPRHTEARKYWQTTAIDEATRMVMATVVTADRPTSDDVAACVVSGIRGVHHPDGTFTGGVPDQIVWDNAGEFLADQITGLALRLQFTGTAVTPYAPYEKGKIESWHRTVQNELYAKLPGYTHGPRTFSGKPTWEPAPREFITDVLLIARAQLWVEQYNTARPHSSLGGDTPLQRWQADPHPLRLATADALYDGMLKAGTTRKVGKSGVRFRTIDYVAASLNGFVGRTIEIRYLPHDDTFIEVFDTTGHHLGTAYNVARISPAQKTELLVARRDQYTHAKALMVEGARLRLERHEDDVLTGAAIPGYLSSVAPLAPQAENIDDLTALLDTAHSPTADPALDEPGSDDSGDVRASSGAVLEDTLALLAGLGDPPATTEAPAMVTDPVWGAPQGATAPRSTACTVTPDSTTTSTDPRKGTS
jgi:putative transposase